MTKIEWTHAPGFKGETWNPIVGCSLVSPGCTNCYAMAFAGRMLTHNKLTPHYAGLTERSSHGHVWTGKIAKAPDAVFLKPLSWKKPRMIFVNSMGDLFHEATPEALIDQVFAIMALCPRHIFLVLTKRAERMRDYVKGLQRRPLSEEIAGIYVNDPEIAGRTPLDMELAVFAAKRPLPNVWLGVTAEDQRRADERIPVLLDTPAEKRFVSAEPLLGPVTVSHYLHDSNCPRRSDRMGVCICAQPREVALDWVIAGGESGNGARAPHPAWFRNLRGECSGAGVPFFFKQWGEWSPDDPPADNRKCAVSFYGDRVYGAVAQNEITGEGFFALMHAIGKDKSGAALDGREHREWPL